MKLIVGLGNPGKEYDGTRHNLGFAIVDAFAEGLDTKFSYEKKFKADIAETIYNGEKIFLAKPQTYMNRSGDAVKEIMAYYNIPTDRVWVVYDDIDLDLGSVRVRTTGSAGGHKGVQSIIDAIGTEEFTRFRAGIKSSECDFLSTEDVVLKKFCKEEVSQMENSVTKATQEIEKALRVGVEHLTA